MTTRIRFHRKLDDLKERLLVMAGMAEQAIQRAVEAYRVRDLSLCDLVERGEISINSFEREIDQMALEMPVDIPRMASLASAMVRKALQAFIEADADLATSVLTMDDNVDKLNDAAFFALSNLIKEQPHLTPQALHALMIARNLERVADHATNVAEDVIFWVRGADVRHHLST
jgi:phosphate transport system protein